jgi:conjugal transfer pilus assembly protein TrbC
VWATDLTLRSDGAVRSAITAGVVLTCCAGAFAQTSPTVTDADIERARRAQPAITDRDIERAQQKHRTPTDAELARVPVPSTPKVDALPQPATRTPIDLDAIAKGFDAQADRPAMAAKAGPGLLIFVSFSMPESTLARLVDQASRARASLVLRGFVNGSLRETVERTQRLMGSRQVSVQIDPQAFDRFAIARTPTFVLVRDGAQPQQCGAGMCFATDQFALAAGDVSLDYALEHIQRASPRHAKDVSGFLKRMKGAGG